MSFFHHLVNYLMLRHTSSGRLLNSFIFPELPFDTNLNEASKWLMIRVILAKVGLFLFFNMFSVFLCRAATKKIAPALDDDPVIIKTFSRILQNSLEQIAIFGSLYFYFLFDKAGIVYLDTGDRFTFDELLVFASWFIYSRVFFMIFYSLGTYVNMVSLRSFGFGVNMALNFMLVELCFSPATPFSNHIFGK